MSVLQFVQQMQVKRNGISPIAFLDDDFDMEVYKKLQRTAQSQIGLQAKLNTVQRAQARRKKWRMQNPQCEKMWVENNRERARRHWRTYRQSERGKQTTKRWRENNREKYNAYQLNWLNANREARNARQRLRSAERYQNDPIYKQKKIEKNRRAYHKHKAKQIEKYGIEGYKAMQYEIYLKRKEGKNVKCI